MHFDANVFEGHSQAGIFVPVVALLALETSVASIVAGFLSNPGDLATRRRHRGILRHDGELGLGEREAMVDNPPTALWPRDKLHTYKTTCICVVRRDPAGNSLWFC